MTNAIDSWRTSKSAGK